MRNPLKFIIPDINIDVTTNMINAYFTTAVANSFRLIFLLCASIGNVWSYKTLESLNVKQGNNIQGSAMHGGRGPFDNVVLKSTFGFVCCVKGCTVKINSDLGKWFS